ncbi:hypothetical protein Hdeb2414_s0008g00287711 [Helianthus debilis subsp. tardiflorus]
MPIQLIKNRIEINSLSRLIQPLNHTHNMITAIPHAYQFINQFIVRMVVHKLLRWTCHHPTTTTAAATALMRLIRWIKLTTLVMMLNPSWFVIIHHVCIGPTTGGVTITWRSSIAWLQMLRWLLLWRVLRLRLRGTDWSAIRVTHWLVRARRGNGGVRHLHRHTVWCWFRRRRVHR